MLIKLLPLIITFFSLTFVIAQRKILNESQGEIDYQLALSSTSLQTTNHSDNLFELLDQTFDNITASSQIKGFNAALITPNDIIWKKASGLASELPTIDSLTTEHLMGMGSITKSFVSVALLLLYEDGLLNLDDSIDMYLPAYPNIPGSTTIRQILSHRSGIHDYVNENPETFDDWLAYPDSIWIIDTLLFNYVLQPNFSPGVDWRYSNTNYLLAGRIIENITGQRWYELVRDRVIDPLELTHTFIYPFETTGAQQVSHVWSDFGNGFMDVQGSGFPIEGLFSLAASAGNILTSPEDLVFFHKQLHGGSLLEEATLIELQTNYSPNNIYLSYGLGALSFNLWPVYNWGHDGDIFYLSVALFFPEYNISIAVQQNDSRAGSQYTDFYDVLISLRNAYIEFIQTTAIHEYKQETKLIVFPNPTTDKLIVELADNSTIDFPISCSLLNITGKLVKSFRLDQDKTELTINDLPTGTYFLGAGNYFTKIFVK